MPRTLHVPNPGYVTPPAAAVEYYFTARDAFRTEATISNRLVRELRATGFGGPTRQPELFFHGEVLNVFNQFQLCGCGETVVQQRRRRPTSRRSGRVGAYLARAVQSLHDQPCRRGQLGQALGSFGSR